MSACSVAEMAPLSCLANPRRCRRRVAVRSNPPGTAAQAADLIALAAVDHPKWSAAIPKFERISELTAVVLALVSLSGPLEGSFDLRNVALRFQVSLHPVTSSFAFTIDEGSDSRHSELLRWWRSRSSALSPPAT